MKTLRRSNSVLALAAMKWSMKKSLLAAGLLVLALGLAAAPAGADLIIGDNGTYGNYTVPATFPSPNTVVTFAQFPYPGVIYNGTAIQVGGLVSKDIQFTSSNTNGTDGAYISAGYTYSFSGNGLWGVNIPLASMYASHSSNPSNGSMTFTFANPVSAVGAFMNYIPNLGGPYSVVLAALGQDLITPLESWDLVISPGAAITTTGLADAGAFRGIGRLTADIYAFRLTVANSDLALTDLRDNGSPVPLPGSVWLLGSGFLALFGLRRQFKG